MMLHTTKPVKLLVSNVGVGAKGLGLRLKRELEEGERGEISSHR